MVEICDSAALKAKKEKYQLLTEQISALIEGETDSVSVMANVCSAIHDAMGFFWTGFYRVNNGELILGPFQGPVACMHIGYGRGLEDRIEAAIRNGMEGTTNHRCSRC